MSEFGAIILAAGPSSRIGQPKQLLKVAGETLIQRCINTALEVCVDTVTVLGAHYHKIHHEIKYIKTHEVFNLNWNKGMCSSIRRGLYELNSVHPGLDGMFILACDQPQVTADLLRQMIARLDKNCEIIAASCQKKLTTPLLVGRRYFKELLKMGDYDGLPPLLEGRYIAFIPFGHDYNIDTPEDWKAYKLLFRRY